MKVILIGHGKTAIALKEATEMIFGNVDFFIPITFLPKEGLEELTSKLENVIQTFDDKEEILVLADLFSGTPYNAASTLALQGKVTDVITGLSLPMCLDIAGTALTNPTVKAVEDSLEKNCSSYIQILSQVLANEKDEEEDF